MRLFRGLALAAALLAFGVAVLGSWVRINGAGLTCPDWPLCNGALVPALHGAVVLEWAHRSLALVETFLLVAVLAVGWPERRRIAGLPVTIAIIAGLFAVQVLLGAATVVLGNSPLSVVLHWATGMALLAALAVLAVLARYGRRREPLSASGAGTAGALGFAAALAFVVMALGSFVSSSFAGLACASLPTCDGTLLGHTPAQFAQMSHRIAAGAFACVAAFATLAACRGNAGRARSYALAGLALTAFQIALGAANVLWALPVALREAHAANAAATFLAYVLAASFAALEPAPVAARAARALRAPAEAAATR